MFRDRVRLTGWLFVPFATALGCTSLPPPHTDEGSLRVDSLLQAQQGKDELTRFAGRPPSVCVTSTADTEICEWRLGNRHIGWAPLAKAIGTTDQVNLICELPKDGTPRASRSCNAYPRRSNRGRFPIPSASSAGRRHPTERAKVRERYRRQTNRALAAARTLAELVHLVGAAPNDCVPHSSGLQTCLWRATARTYGHGTLAMSIGAPKYKRVRLRCQLPTDGSDRAPESCTVEIGG